MKIAIPVDVDRHTLFPKTGKAPFYAIFNDCYLVDTLPQNKIEHNNVSEDEHIKAHKAAIESLKGIDVVLVEHIGKNMKQAFEDLGIKVEKINSNKKDAKEIVKEYLACKKEES